MSFFAGYLRLAMFRGNGLGWGVGGFDQLVKDWMSEDHSGSCFSDHIGGGEKGEAYPHSTDLGWIVWMFAGKNYSVKGMDSTLSLCYKWEPKRDI